MQQLHGQLYKACIECCYYFVGNSAVSKGNLWTNGTHLRKSDKMIIAKNLTSFTYF